ncbi:toll/interleukin-1 receptor domain-containing protein [Enterococcus sp. AZ072]|uniref:toll/interleukin-1 receptor domain-containing protein n=1 Tax=unclassified Enterococcus TaxID=2608891 RepID=UPI003D27A160
MGFDKYFLQTYDKTYKGGNRMKKVVVFISHISEESELAVMLKEEIEKKFVGFVEVFVSSDGVSISAGAEWLNQITNALNNASIMIALCSKDSVKRPWINFEMGAGWMKGIKVIPACHTNLLIDQLPSPTDMLQSLSLSNPDHVKRIFRAIAESAGADPTNVGLYELDDLCDKISDFEYEYGFLNKAKSLVEQLEKKVDYFKVFFSEARVGNTYQIMLSESDYVFNKDLLGELERMDILRVIPEPGQESALIFTNTGSGKSYHATLLSNYLKII